MSNTDKRAIIFAQHPTVEGFHFTSDEQAFHLESDAKNHASTLEDNNVDFVKNPKQKVSPEVSVKKEAAKAKLPVTTDEEKEAANTERKALAIEYKELYGKNIAPQFSNEKIKELISAKKAETK